MKNFLFIAASLAVSVSSFAADKAKKDVKKAEKLAPVELKVDPKDSKVTWTGKKLAGSHHGTVEVKEGHLTTNEKGITKGDIAIDLTTIKNEDLTDAGYNKKLIDHLKSPDFFDVEKYPTATYTIESAVQVANIKPGEPNLHTKGKLTIRGISKPYETNLFLDPKGDGYEIKGKIDIDRTEYGLKYNSKKFFDPKALGDKLIDDKFEVNLDLIAKNEAAKSEPAKTEAKKK